MKRFGVFENLYAPVTEVEDDPAIGTEEQELEETEEEEGDLDEDEEAEEEEVTSENPNTAQALQIFEALNNPATAPAMVRFLNAQLEAQGLAPVTKSDLKDITLSDILKEGFGEEYTFLQEKLGPALEKAINQGITAKIGPLLEDIKTQQQNLQLEIANTKISAALDPIIEEMGAEEFDKIAEPLSKVMARYPNTANLPMKKYIKDMIALTENSLNSPSRTEKIRKNVREAKRNRASGAEPDKIKIGSKTPTIREAVQLAMQGKQIED